MHLSRAKIDPYLLTFAGIVLPAWTVISMTWVGSWTYFWCVLIASWILGANISMFAHRAWCHRSWHPNAAINWIGLVVFHLTMVGNSIGWVGVHREHHRFCDTNKDPHSPLYRSRWHIQLLSYFNRVKPQYILDLARDTKHKWFYRWYWQLNFAVWIALAVIDIWLLGWWMAVLGLTIFKLHTINSLCHATPRWLLPVQNTHTSTNSLLMVLLNINNGEAWHKNHHVNASAWSFRQRWYEIDPPAAVIWLLTRLGWATV